MENEEKKLGTFIESLKRNNSKIREDRATAISEDAELIYKRGVEDIEVELRKLKMDRNNMLDMSPDNSLSLKLASDFNASEFFNKDMELGIKIRNTEIKLDIVKKQYEALFGRSI